MIENPLELRGRIRGLMRGKIGQAADVDRIESAEYL